MQPEVQLLTQELLIRNKDLHLVQLIELEHSRQSAKSPDTG